MIQVLLVFRSVLAVGERALHASLDLTLWGYTKAAWLLSKTVPGSECDPQVTGAWLIIKLCCLVTTEANIRGPTSFGNIPFTFPIVHTSVITTPKEGRMLFWKYYSAVSKRNRKLLHWKQEKVWMSAIVWNLSQDQSCKNNSCPTTSLRTNEALYLHREPRKNNNEKYISLEWLYFGQTVQSRNLFRPF